MLGVDPDARMAEFARRTGVEVEVSTFEAWDPAGRTFDAVVAGQAWQWVDLVAGPAKAERVRRPAGGVGHVFDPPPAVADAFATVCRRVAPASPFSTPPAGSALAGYQAMFAAAADGIRAAGGFGGPEQWRFDRELSYTRDEWLDLLPTQGILIRLAPYTTLAATAART